MQTAKTSPPSTVLDIELLRTHMEGDAQVLRDIVGSFLREAPILERAVVDSLTCSDTATLTRTAHTLKGLLLTLAARPAAEAALRLEMFARGGHLADAHLAWRDLQSEMTRLSPALDNLVREAA